MKNRFKITRIMAALLVSGGIGYADVNMQEGLWETVSTMEMTGMPMPMSMPPMTYRQCITKKELIPKQKKEEEQNCKITKQETDGDTVKWEIICSGEGAMKGKGEITYRGKTFEGTIITEVNNPEMGTMKMTTHLKGQYIGECKK